MTNQNGSVLLVITGSIAAVKCYDLVRGLLAKRIAVECVLTRAAQEFVTPMALAALTGKPVHTELWDAQAEATMGHIALSRRNALVVVAPASANFLAKMAHGLADDLASTLLLATDKPVLAAPAMNVRMWYHPATQRNVAQLQQDGIQLIGPAQGALACGEEGFGRMVEVEAIIEAIEGKLHSPLEGKSENAIQHFPVGGHTIANAQTLTASANASSTPPAGCTPQGGSKFLLKGKKVLITAGPTQEPIDPVRFISNHSSGKQGYAIAQALQQAGAEVTLVSGPTNLPKPYGVNLVPVLTADEMLAACLAALPADIAICTAAVADWKVAHTTGNKLKKTRQAPAITLLENPDILNTLSHHKNRPELVIGFAAETENLLENAKAKRVAKGCDWLLANDVKANAVFGQDTTCIEFITANTVEPWGALPKAEVATRLVQQLDSYFTAIPSNKGTL